MARLRIDSPKNDRVKALLRLHERRVRERERRTLLEGVREIGRALDAGIVPDAVWLASETAPAEAHELAARAERAGVPVVDVSDAAFARLSRRQAPDGLIAVAPPPGVALDDLALPADPLLLVAVGTEKPGNLGALARSADAAGADALIVADEGGTDLGNPHVVRASMGSIYALPCAAAEPDALAAWLDRHGVALVATSPDADVDVWDADLTGPVAIVLGPEHAGLSERWLAAARERVRIPMRGAADSLNVSVTGALLLFEALRQRRSTAAF